jgi:hypothetical protein
LDLRLQQDVFDRLSPRRLRDLDPKSQCGHRGESNRLGRSDRESQLGHVLLTIL